MSENRILWERLNKLQTYSFLLNYQGNGVVRVNDSCGAYIEKQKVAEIIEDAQSEINELLETLEMAAQLLDECRESGEIWIELNHIYSVIKKATGENP